MKIAGNLSIAMAFGGGLLSFLHIAGGAFLIIVGILIITGYFAVLNSLFIKFTPLWLLKKI